MAELLYKDEVYQIVGAAMEVHSSLGCGFLEQVYYESLEIEMSLRKIPFTSKYELPIYYKEHRLNKIYIADFLAFDKVIVEIKSLDFLSGREEAQILNYLKATNIEAGLLINFGTPRLEWKRKVLTRSPKVLNKRNSCH